MSCKSSGVERSSMAGGPALEGGKSQGASTFVPTGGEENSVSLQKSVKPIPTKILDAYRNHPDRALFLQKALNVATKVGALAGNVEANPILNVFPAPLMMFHDSKRLKRRFQMMCTAAKSSQLAETVFQAVKSADALGDILGNTSKTGLAVCQLAGYSSLAIFGVICTVVIPKFFMTASLIGMTADLWGFIRVVNAYKEFCHRKGNEDFASLLSTLEYLKEGNKACAYKCSEGLRKDIHVEHHFRNKDSYHVMKGRVEKVFRKVDPVVRQAQNFLLQMRNKTSFDKAADVIEKAYNGNLPTQQALSEIMRCQEEIQKQIDTETLKVDANDLKEFQEHRQTFMEKAKTLLNQETQSIIHDADSEMRRMLFNNMLILLIDMLFLAAATSLNVMQDNQEREEIVNILLMTGCLAHMSYILLDSIASPQKEKRS